MNESDNSNRIHVEVNLEGVRTQAVMDTGGLYFVCPPTIADLIGLQPAMSLADEHLTVRGCRYEGSLYRLNLTLIADDGADAQNEVTTFVPSLESGELWPWPCFLGFQYCLERFRLGLDPARDLLYFDPLE